MGKDRDIKEWRKVHKKLVILGAAVSNFVDFIGRMLSDENYYERIVGLSDELFPLDSKGAK